MTQRSIVAPSSTIHATLPAALLPAVSVAPLTTPVPPKDEKTDWHKPTATYVAFAGLFASLIFNYFGFRGVQTQIRLQRESQEQNLPVDFRLLSQVSQNGDGLIKIRNSGRAELVEIESRIRFYFVFDDGRILTAQGLGKLLAADPAALSLCQSSNLLVNAEDVINLIEKPRNFSVTRMSPNGGPDGSDEFSPEISPSSVLNALRLAYVLKARVVVRCKFDYQHRTSLQVFNRQFYILIKSIPDGDVLKFRPGEVIDLAKIIGGKAVIDVVPTYEYSTQEVIFSD